MRYFSPMSHLVYTEILQTFRSILSLIHIWRNERKRQIANLKNKMHLYLTFKYKTNGRLGCMLHIQLIITYFYVWDRMKHVLGDSKVFLKLLYIALQSPQCITISMYASYNMIKVGFIECQLVDKLILVSL